MIGRLLSLMVGILVSYDSFACQSIWDGFVSEMGQAEASNAHMLAAWSKYESDCEDEEFFLLKKRVFILMGQMMILLKRYWFLWVVLTCAMKTNGGLFV